MDSNCQRHRGRSGCTGPCTERCERIAAAAIGQLGKSHHEIGDFGMRSAKNKVFIVGHVWSGTSWNMLELDMQ